jgi:DNA-binding transcriptional regulator YiaG
MASIHKVRSGKSVKGSRQRISKKSTVGAKPSLEQSSPIGERLIAGMESLLTTMKGGGLAAVQKKFTVRKVKMATFEVPTLGKEGVLAIRTSLGVSQPVFASLLGVSPALVKGWEQGVKVPSGVALRFLAEVRRNPDYWKARVKEAASVA